MKTIFATLAVLSLSGFAADSPPAKPFPAITPGKVIIPLEKMRRIWGELISLDLATRTGTFRNESNNEVMSFTVMPYAELLHHATLGDLQDFKVGERAIFRLHVNEKEQWVWLTYIQDEMNMMNGHGEYFFVDQIDATTGKLTTTWAKGDMTFVREKNVVIETDKDTRFWKAGQPAKFSDIKTGDKLRTKTHGIGHGKTRMVWEVFLDDESLLKFQTEQKAVHAKRILEEGVPGYVDASSGTQLTLTLFNEGVEQIKLLKQGSAVQVAPAGVDRKPTAAPITGKVTNVGKNGRQAQVTLELTASGDKFQPTGIARLWLVQP
ncbi:MAG: hypothetical protein K9N47_05280 [Prosthecobacter sp.]|uniref:hypothetical protein n=1 Tax=Prosthecobacter sp. TaxID=1965333 RepID=UPI0025CF5D54|nr:hypothetical protein [Prosthecobacter sp.]MCF7785512.1 hypothetical protein [Prosthecobacter sp.]